MGQGTQPFPPPLLGSVASAEAFPPLVSGGAALGDHPDTQGKSDF